MISEEDESSSVLNGRLRPRKSTATIPNSPIKSYFKPEYKVAQDKPKRNNIPSKASPNKQDDLTAKADSSPLAQLLCPYCDRKFTTKLSASKHARRIHPCTSKQDNFISCLFCNHSAATPVDIIRHMVDDHPKQYFACLKCKSRFLSTADLKKHKLNVCEKQKQAYRSKLRQKTSPTSKKDKKKINAEDKNPCEKKEVEHEFNSVVISCELKPSQVHEAVDIEDKITTNLILPSNISNTGLENNAVIILDDIQWNRRIPPNFSFRNADADQILSRLGVVHRSPRVGESTRREWLKLIDDNSQKFEKCFDTNFYSRVASNVQENLARFLDGSFNFSPDPDKVIKTRKSKSSAIINTAEGFPILLPHEQYSRNRFDGYMPRAIAPKHKWKWDSTENEKNIIIDANVIKRDNHVDNCIITLVSSLDIWTQLRMRRKFEGIFCKAPPEKIEKQNIIGRQLKEILESREIPCSKSQMVTHMSCPAAVAAAAAVATAGAPAANAKNSFEFPSFLGLSARVSDSMNSAQSVPAVLSGEWVRPRCYVCCACGDQTRESRALTAHMAAHHPNAQVQHYEIVGESLLNADILKHLYVPPSQMSNRTRPLRGFRDCTKCKKSIALEDLHQHMLDCAGDTPTVRRKCRSRPFGVRKRRPRLPDNAIRKKIRKDFRTRHNQKSLLRTRPRIRTEVGDAETIRKMLADLPAKRHRSAEEHTTQQVLRPRRKLDKLRNKIKIKRLASKDTKTRKNQKDRNDSSIIDEDDQPLKPKTKTEKTVPVKKRFSSRVLASKNKKGSTAAKEVPALNEHQQDAPTFDASSSQSQQISGENSTQRLNVNASENYNGEGENHDRPDTNKERELSEDSAVPDPTLLKHSISNITGSDSTLQVQQQSNTEDIRPHNETYQDKPHSQTNQKSSEKKRQSLLNCIEKIKSQQKGETTSNMKKHRKASVPTHLSLHDPNPAVISCTRDESGAANNVIPDNIRRPQTHEADDPNYSKYRIRSDLETQSLPNETFMFVPQPLYHPQMFTDSVFTSSGANLPFGIPRDKLSAIQASVAQNEHDPTQVAQSHYHPWPESQWKIIQHMHSRIQHSQLQHPLFQRLILPSNIQPQGFQDHPIHYESSSIPGPYDTSDLHHGDRRNETAHYPYHHDISSASPQLWSRESSQIQVNNNHSVQSMLSANEPVIPTTLRTAQKRALESSDTDVYSNRWSLGDAYVMLNNANVPHSSLETTATVCAPLISLTQGITNRESPQSYNTSKRPKPQKDISSIEKYDSTSCIQDGHGRTYDNASADADVTSKSAKHYHTVSSQTTAIIKYQNDGSPLVVKEGNSMPRSRNTVDDFHLKNLYTSNLNERKIHGRFSAEHPHLSPSVPTETQAAKLTPSPNDSIIQNSIDTPDHNEGNIQSSLNRNKRTLCSVVNNDQEISEDQTGSGLTEEPLDLSGKKMQAICNDERAFGVTQTHSVLSARTQYYVRNTAQVDSVRDIGSAFEQNEGNEYVSIGLSFKNNSQSTHNKSSDTTCKTQDMPCMIDQNNALKHSPPSCKRSSVEFYKNTNQIETDSHDKMNENNYANENIPNAFSGQLPHEKDKQYHNEVQFVSNDFGKSEMARAFESQMNLLASRGSAIASNRLDKVREKLSPTCLNTSAVYPEQNIFQKKSHSVDTTYVQNVLSDDNNPNTTISLIDHDPETAKKAVKLPKLVSKKQNNDYLDEVFQMPQKGRAAVPLITNQTRENVMQHVEDTSTEVYTPTVCDALTNSNTRLTVNTATLPSSSILPKKRHSPSARLNSQDAYSNMTLSKTQEQPPSTIISVHNRNHLWNAPAENAFDVNDKRIDKIIEITDDELNHSKTNTNTPNTNVLPIQESIPKQQNTPKNFNEKTASLRAVRFKAPLARKSISDEKQPITKVYSQQFTCLDLSQKDLKTDQLAHLECDSINFTVDNTAQNAECHANVSTSGVNTRTIPKNVVQIENETSMPVCEQIKQCEMSAVACNVVAEKVDSVVKQFNSLIEQKNITMSCKDPPVKTVETKIVGRKTNEHDVYLVTKKSTIDAACDSKKVTNIISDHVALSDSVNLTRSEQIYDVVGNYPIDTKNNTGIHIDSQVNATLQILKSTKNSNTNTTLIPAITISHETSTENMVSMTKLNEDEDSDDDISLALIVKQKQQEQTSGSVIDSNKHNIPIHTRKEKKSSPSTKPNQALKTDSTDSELLLMNTTLNTINEDEPLIAALKFNEARKSNACKPHTINSTPSIVNEDKPLIVALKVDEARETNAHAINSDNTANELIENLTVKASYKNDIDKENTTEIKQDHEINDLANNKEIATSRNLSNNEDASENSLIEDAELTPVTDVPNEKNDDTLVFQINANKNIDVDYEANELLWKNNCQSKSMHANTQNNSNETHNEIQPSSYINQKENSTQPSEADEGNVSLVLQNTKNVDILNTTTELEPLSGDADTMNTNKIPDSELSLNFKETNRRALRRSKRGKSMFSDDIDLNYQETMEVNHINVQKPVTIKQLIFSKLLRNDNLQGEKNMKLISNSVENVTSMTSAPALKMTTKRNKSPIKTKNKKKKSCDINNDYESDLDNLNCTPENNNKKLQQSFDTADDNGSNTEVSEKSNNCSEDKIGNPDYNDNRTIKSEKKNTSNSRTACYNRPIGHNQTSTSIPVKKPENYDPYDIDLDMDMAETTRPIVKRKVNKTISAYNTNKSSKKNLRNEVPCCSPVDIIRQESDLANRKLNVTTPPTVSDSDSSISDAPLQKYVEEKEKLNSQNLKSSDCNKSREASKIPFDDEIASISGKAQLTSSYDEQASETNAEIAERETYLTNPTDDISPQNVTGIKDITSHRNLNYPADQITSFDEIENVVDISIIKSVVKQKKKSRSIIPIETESLNVSNEAAQSVTANEMESLNVSIDTEQSITTNETESNETAQSVIANEKESVNVPNETAQSVPANETESLSLSNETALSVNANETESVNVSNETAQSVTANETELLNVSNETEQQLSSDKYMENFGFYFERQPRLCNIMALKKIAETFKNFKNDEDLLGSKDRQKKSTNIENKKTTVGARTSKLTQDTNNTNSVRKNRTAFQSTLPQDTDGTNMIDKQNPANDGGEVDFIATQKMLGTEDKLERELYSEFKKAAEAIAGKTSRFNQLRAEETSVHDNNIHDVAISVENDIEMKTIKKPDKPERIVSPERSLSPEMPESPKSIIKDKPLMYPEEEVNIYEDKYDIIKRRREATANAKQVSKVDNPKKSKIVKKQKKPERKICKKITKKAIYQGSQVPTKGALKGFDGIKISIPTQDLNMPPNVSPPHQPQRQSRSKKSKESLGKANLGSNYKSDSDAYPIEEVTPDIYEFKDDERPVTKGYRLTKVSDKSSSNEIEENLEITHKEKYNMANDSEKECAKIRKTKGKGKGKGKRTYADNDTNKEIHEKQKVTKKEKQIQEKQPELLITYGSETEQVVDDCEQPVQTIVEDDDGLSIDNKKNLGTLQDNVEPFEDSDSEMPTAMPGTSGFVPDRNDESSYDSDSSSRTPLVLKGPYACTCLSEIDSDDSETERGCAHILCRYSHLNAAKHLVMGKIFKSNAVRCDKPDESPEESPKPKPDLDRLFDSLLEPNINNNASETRINICPVPGPSSASTFHSTIHSQTQINKSLLNEKEVSIGENVFSSPNGRDSDKIPKKVFKCAYKASIPNDVKSSKVDDEYNFGEKTEESIFNKKDLMIHKLIQTDFTRLLPTSAYDLQAELETGKETELVSKTHLNIYDRTSNNSLDIVLESSDNMIKTRGTQTKYSFPMSDNETSSCEGELNATKIARRNRRANKRHKSHHKRNKVYQYEEFHEQKDDSTVTASKQSSRSKIVIEETESIGKKRSYDKTSPSSRSDKEFSTNHNNSADAYVMATAEEMGMAVQRVRRKCTVGKQNVLAEHWSSSESEAGSAPNRAKGRKSSVSKKVSRTGKKERANRCSRGGESDDGEAGGTRTPVRPKVRARAASAVAGHDRDRDRDSGSDAERDMKQEQHGWIVGRSHKKLVTMLACCKSKPRLEVKEKEKKK